MCTPAETSTRSSWSFSSWCMPAGPPAPATSSASSPTSLTASSARWGKGAPSSPSSWPPWCAKPVRGLYEPLRRSAVQAMQFSTLQSISGVCYQVRDLCLLCRIRAAILRKVELPLWAKRKYAGHRWGQHDVILDVFCGRRKQKPLPIPSASVRHVVLFMCSLNFGACPDIYVKNMFNFYFKFLEAYCYQSYDLWKWAQWCF